MKRNTHVTDYHDFVKYDTPRQEREKLHVGDLWVNGALCKQCGVFIRSRNRHDFVTCDCGAISVDGGSWYQKLLGDMDLAIPISVYFYEVKKHEDSV